jgi:hypothetical protein
MRLTKRGMRLAQFTFVIGLPLTMMLVGWIENGGIK